MKKNTKQYKALVEQVSRNEYTGTCYSLDNNFKGVELNEHHRELILENLQDKRFDVSVNEDGSIKLYQHSNRWYVIKL